MSFHSSIDFSAPYAFECNVINYEKVKFFIGLVVVVVFLINKQQKKGKYSRTCDPCTETFHGKHEGSQLPKTRLMTELKDKPKQEYI